MKKFTRYCFYAFAVQMLAVFVYTTPHDESFHLWEVPFVFSGMGFVYGLLVVGLSAVFSKRD